MTGQEEPTPNQEDSSKAKKAQENQKQRYAVLLQADNAVNEAITSTPAEQKLTPWNYVAVSSIGLSIAEAIAYPKGGPKNTWPWQGQSH